MIAGVEVIAKEVNTTAVEPIREKTQQQRKENTADEVIRETLEEETLAQGRTDELILGMQDEMNHETSRGLIPGIAEESAHEMAEEQALETSTLQNAEDTSEKDRTRDAGQGAHRITDVAELADRRSKVQNYLLAIFL